jgi:hypothetical protein
VYDQHPAQGPVHALAQIAFALQREMQTVTRHVAGTTERRVLVVGRNAQLEVLDGQGPRLLQGVLQQTLSQIGSALRAQYRDQAGFGQPGHRGLGKDDQGGGHR